MEQESNAADHPLEFVNSALNIGEESKEDLQLFSVARERIDHLRALILSEEEKLNKLNISTSDEDLKEDLIQIEEIFSTIPSVIQEMKQLESFKANSPEFSLSTLDPKLNLELENQITKALEYLENLKTFVKNIYVAKKRIQAKNKELNEKVRYLQNEVKNKHWVNQALMGYFKLQQKLAIDALEEKNATIDSYEMQNSLLKNSYRSLQNEIIKLKDSIRSLQNEICLLQNDNKMLKDQNIEQASKIHEIQKLLKDKEISEKAKEEKKYHKESYTRRTTEFKSINEEQKLTANFEERIEEIRVKSEAKYKIYDAAIAKLEQKLKFMEERNEDLIEINDSCAKKISKNRLQISNNETKIVRLEEIEFKSKMREIIADLRNDLMKELSGFIGERCYCISEIEKTALRKGIDMNELEDCKKNYLFREYGMDIATFEQILKTKYSLNYFIHNTCLMDEERLQHYVDELSDNDNLKMIYQSVQPFIERRAQEERLKGAPNHCRKCGDAKHKTKWCPNCYFCDDDGHRAKDCPRRKAYPQRNEDI